jgi:hypothetical protein
VATVSTLGFLRPAPTRGRGAGSAVTNGCRLEPDAPGAGRTDRGRSLAIKTQRKPYLVRLKPKCADAYAGKLQVGREYQALFSLENAKYMSIVGTDVTHALKAHFDIRPT